MGRKLTPIFATQNDLSIVLSNISSKRPFNLVVCGMFDSPLPVVVENFEELKPFANYLVLDRDRKVSVRVVPQRRGGDRFAIDQQEKVDSICLQLGGMIEGERLVGGQVATISSSPTSDEIYAIFSKAIRKQFEKINFNYVGPEAVQLLDRGFRLSATDRSPEKYDLSRE